MREGVSLQENFREQVERVKTDPTLNSYAENTRADVVAGITAKHSVLHEINIASEVQDALQEEEVQRAIAQKGYASISLVKPLVALVDRHTGAKAVIYPWQEGYKLNDSEVAPVSDPEYKALDYIADTIEGILTQRRIDAHDLALGQFIVEIDSEGQRHLHLTDIDRFWRF